MVDGLVYALENAVVRYSVEGKVPAPLGTKHPSVTPFQSFRTAEWIGIFSSRGVPNGPVNTMAEVTADPNLRYRKMIVDLEQPEAGTVNIAGSPFRLSETP